jgi:hypothetical protein
MISKTPEAAGYLLAEAAAIREAAVQIAAGLVLQCGSSSSVA